MLIKIRRATSAQWASANPILADGELGVDLTLNRIKVGNGVGAWSVLSFIDKRVIKGDGLINQVVGTGAVITTPHGLGRSPDGIDFWYECIVASNGYAVGERVFNFNANPPAIFANYSNVSIAFPSISQTSVMGKTGGSVTLTRANWRAYAVPFIYE